MKRLLILLLPLLFISGSLQAQTWDEWFRQKKTQKKYLVQQIAALKVYIGHARKGYRIAKEGWQTISGVTGGELSLHEAFFSSLSAVNPAVEQYAGIDDIITMQLNIIENCSASYGNLDNSAQLSQNEMDYVQRVHNRLLADCAQTLDALITMTSDGALQMKDGQRMQRIDKLSARMRDNYTFARTFNSRAKLLALARLKEKTDVKSARTLLGIQNQ